MNWTWNVRSNDGAMNGLEFARCTTAGGFGRVLIHAAPGKAKVEVIDGDDRVVARADLERAGEYSPMTLVELDGAALRRSEVWPTEQMYGLPVLLSGGEVGILQEWQHSDDRSWWRWSVEFSNHTGRPDDWAPRVSTSAATADRVHSRLVAQARAIREAPHLDESLVVSALTMPTGKPKAAVP
jgi:hypothetical protein